jgi:perosamine synthetase
MALAQRHGLLVIEDACHALGAEYRGRKIGSIAHLSAFSLHPVKHMTTGEGGVITTNDAALAARLRRLRNHGIDSDHRVREQQGTWRYDMVELGYNYRLTDFQSALGLSQLAKMPGSLARRRALADRYAAGFASASRLRLQDVPDHSRHAWHLYPVRVVGRQGGADRQAVFNQLRAAGIGVNVHYLPVYLHSYYRSLGYPEGLCPVAEAAYDELLSLPMWAGLTDSAQDRVVSELVSQVSAPRARASGG